MKILDLTDRKFSRRGFTLVELLTTIAILVVISSVALGVYAGIHSSSENTKNRKNAQTIAALYAAARSAGATFSSPPGDLTGRITELVGGRSGEGILTSSKFQLSPMSVVEVSKATSLLNYDADGDIISVKP